MVNPLGGARLSEPMVFRLNHPVHHMFKTYQSLTFRRQASIEDVAIGQAIKNDDRRVATVVLARLAKVPKGVMAKIHDDDLVALIDGTSPLFELA